MSGVKGIIGMHRFNICLVVVLSLSCSGVKAPLLRSQGPVHKQGQVNYTERKLQFKSISLNFIGSICLQAHSCLA